jgi:hypothetical protein
MIFQPSSRIVKYTLNKSKNWINEFSIVRFQSRFASSPLSRAEAQHLLESNPVFRQAVLEFTTYRDRTEGMLGGPQADLIDKAIQLDYGIRLRSRIQELQNQQARGSVSRPVIRYDTTCASDC